MNANSLSMQELLFFENLYNFIKTSHPEMLSIFGIWRVHQHFEVASDEVLHEISDVEHRESTVSVIKKAEIPHGAFASSWVLSEKGPTVALWCCDHHPRPGF